VGLVSRLRVGGAGAPAARFRRRWGFDPPPGWSDTLGYEVLLDEIERGGIARVEGDVLEIGALLGGGTAKLCGWFARNAAGKLVVTVDVFDPEFDATATAEGWSMGELYAARLGDRDQRSVFDEVTRGCENLRVVVGDSTAVEVPVKRLAFAFVDGSHVPADVRSDFELVWTRLSPGGIAAFHDYGGDLPGVTQTLHECIGAHADEIARVWTRSPLVLFVQRRCAEVGASDGTV
jgi:methyltransferase family protein